MSGISQKSMSNAYTFWMISLIFGLPLLSSFYLIQFHPNYSTDFLIPYALIAVIVGLLILRYGRPSDYIHNPQSLRSALNSRTTDFLLLSALTLATLAVIAFGVMKYFIDISYPSPSKYADAAGAAYFVAVSLAVLLGFPALITRVFPQLRSAMNFRAGRVSYGKIAVVIGAVYFVTYMVLVNQILITGFNSLPGNYILPVQGHYPSTSVFTAGPPPAAFAEDLIYVPYILVQLSPSVNFIFQPFEVMFAVVLSTLVASTFVLTNYFIRKTAGHSCVTGATASGFGGFLGLTATCPSCLVPTLVSAFFGGVTAVQSSYSSLGGVVLPPIVSIASLLAAVIYLNDRTGKINVDLLHPLKNLL
jgi:hypothetical protein